MSKQARRTLGGLGVVLAVVSIALLAYAFAPASGRVEKTQLRLEPTVFQAPPATVQVQP